MTGSEIHRVAIIETGGSHDEVILPQLMFLQDESLEIHLIMRRKHYERTGPFDKAIRCFLLEKENNIADRLKNLHTITRYLSDFRISDVIINTAQGAFIRDLSFLLSRDLNITGIAHNPQKLGRSFSQKLITRTIKKYFVLSDYILKNVQQENPGLTLTSFYPVFFPPFTKENHRDKLDICIPGAMDTQRRDYHGLLLELERSRPDENIRFVFLGRCQKDDALALRKKIESLLPPSQRLFFSEFIPVDEFMQYSGNASIILPLLTPSVPMFDLYRKYKVTGAMNIAFGLKIPMVLHEALLGIDDFAQSSFFYSEGEMISTINHLCLNREELAVKKHAILDMTKFSFEYQKKKYLDFLNL